MKILHAVSEIYPVVKTGGLADVAAALPPAQALMGAEVRILVPGYPSVMDAAHGVHTILADEDLFGGGRARICEALLDGVDVPTFILDCPGHFDRPGGPYQAPDKADWPDNDLRFAAFGWAAERLGSGIDPTFRPDVLHGHDWQAGLAIAFLALDGVDRPHLVATIHNIAYQGLFPAEALDRLSLPPEIFTPDGVEYHGRIGFLKAAIRYADKVTTVSRTYAREIQTPEQGHGLEGLLAARSADLVGIVNGIDTALWDPKSDPALPRSYSARSLDRKIENKKALLARFGLPEMEGAPLFAVVSRLTWHKGLDLLLGAIPALMEKGVQLVVLGSGEAALEAGFIAAARRHPDRIAVEIGYDETLSHLMQGGADVILVPSRSEPCGLTQLYGLRYGTLPLVRRTGGLADTVVNADPAAVGAGRATGFVFDEPTVDALSGTLAWVVDLWQDRALWRKLQRTAMAQDFGWQAAAAQYLDVYRSIAR